MCIQFFSANKLLFILLLHSQQPKARDTLGKSTLLFFLHALLDLVRLGGKLPFTLLMLLWYMQDVWSVMFAFISACTFELVHLGGTTGKHSKKPESGLLFFSLDTFQTYTFSCSFLLVKYSMIINVIETYLLSFSHNVHLGGATCKLASALFMNCNIKVTCSLCYLSPHVLLNLHI